MIKKIVLIAAGVGAVVGAGVVAYTAYDKRKAYERYVRDREIKAAILKAAVEKINNEEHAESN